MKAIIVLLGLLLSFQATAAKLDLSCDVVKLNDDNVFEEGLGETGDTYADGDSQHVSLLVDGDYVELEVGQFGFESDDDDKKVKYTKTKKFHKVQVTQKGGLDNVQVRVYLKSKKGIVLVKEEADSRYKTVAEIDCNDYSKIKKYIKSNKAVLKRVKMSSLSKDLQRKLSSIDVAFEMGDGYYGVIWEKVYRVLKEGKTVGFKLEYKLDYTEDDEPVYADIYILANGVRFSGPNDNYYY